MSTSGMQTYFDYPDVAFAQETHRPDYEIDNYNNPLVRRRKDFVYGRIKCDANI